MAAEGGGGGSGGETPSSRNLFGHATHKPKLFPLAEGVCAINFVAATISESRYKERRAAGTTVGA